MSYPMKIFNTLLLISMETDSGVVQCKNCSTVAMIEYFRSELLKLGFYGALVLLRPDSGALSVNWEKKESAILLKIQIKFLQNCNFICKNIHKFMYSHINIVIEIDFLNVEFRIISNTQTISIQF